MELIHVLSRGVDKRDIFLDEQDHFRFVHDLFEFNDQQNADNNSYYFRNNHNKIESIDIASRYIKPERRKRKLLVNIYAFCLMKNHYHLLLNPKLENAIPKFMKKLNMGYSKYFNAKYKRSGTLFEGRYKSVIIKDEAHFIHIPYYIHFNPLDFKFPEWRNRKLKSYKKALKFLESYRWSSHLDYLGKKNFPSITQRDFLSEFFGGPVGYKKNIIQWLGDISDTDMESFGDIRNFILE